MIQETLGLTKIQFKIKFGEFLVDNKFLSEDQIQLAIKIQKNESQKGKILILGEIISDQFGISKKDIEEIFSKYLFMTFSKHFYEAFREDPMLSGRFGEIDNYIENADFNVPFWEKKDSESNNLISGEITFLIRPKDSDPITVNVPFDYVIEDQVSNIDLLGALDYIREELIQTKGWPFFTDVDSIGIPINELDE